jgi:hypothetical protein
MKRCDDTVVSLCAEERLERIALAIRMEIAIRINMMILVYYCLL